MSENYFTLKCNRKWTWTKLAWTPLLADQSTPDPPAASLNCFHQHTERHFRIPPVPLVCFWGYLFLCRSGFESKPSTHTHGAVSSGYFSGRIKRRRASGPGSSGESAWNDGIHHFQVNVLKCHFRIRHRVSELLNNMPGSLGVWTVRGLWRWQHGGNGSWRIIQSHLSFISYSSYFPVTFITVMFALPTCFST